MRIRSAKIEELKPKARERALSPRQLAALQREEEIRKALGRLKSDEDILAIELDASEKIPTMRAAVKKAIAAHRPGHLDGDPRPDDLRLLRAAARWAGSEAQGVTCGRPGRRRRTARVPRVPPADAPARSRAA